MLCVILWLQDDLQGKDNPEISVIEKFETHKSSNKKSNQIFIPPLVQQAKAYALYLNPPKPPAPKIISRPQKPVYRPPVTTPKFRLLSTSYYRSNPERSLALVSEPGKGDHWIAKGERVGNFVVERVENGSIVYRVGNQSHEMKITINQSIQIAQIKSNLSASTLTIKPDLRLLNTSKLSEME